MMAQRRKGKQGGARMAKLIVVAEADGSIVGAMLADGVAQKNVRVEFRPMPGQTVHEVHIDERLVRDRAAHEVHAALSAYRVVPGQSRLVTTLARARPARGRK
jgi:hypothetical protein